MPKLRAFISRLNAPFIRERQDRELALELTAHVQMLTDDNIRAGMPPDEAGRQAQLILGGMESVKEECRDRWDIPLISSLWRDLRYAARSLRRNPNFAATAIITLALGIGANTAIFNWINAVLFRNLPVPNPGQLMFFGAATAEGSTDFFPNGNTQLFSYPFFRELRHTNSEFSDVAAINSILFATHGRLAHKQELEKLNVELVSGSYFNTLGVTPVLGRTLSDADDQAPGAHPVATASYSWWQRRLAKDPSAVGATVTIGGTVYAIVGVTPPEFSGVTVGQSPDLWIPLAMEKQISPGWNGLDKELFQSLHVFGRLKPGATVEQAQTGINIVFRRLLRGYAGPSPSQQRLQNIDRARIQLTSAATGRSNLRDQFSSPLAILMGVVALVLVIACANVANLLLARATARQREIAVRMSMGAGRSRLIGQLLAESGLLGLSGALLGVLLAWGASRLILMMVSTGAELLPMHLAPDIRVLGFTLAAAMFAVLLFGTAPAFYATRLNLTRSLKEARVVSARNSLGRWLVASQVAVSLVLLVCAGLFLQSLSNLRNVNTGFDKQNVLVIGVDPGAAGYQLDGRVQLMMRRVEERVGSLPGVSGASFAYFVFDRGSWSTDNIVVSGEPAPKEGPASVDHNLIGPQYFDVMKMPVIAGRALTLHDDRTSRRVAVINQTMARTWFHNDAPLGQTFGFHDDEQEWQNIEVVGVVRDAKYTSLQEEQLPAAFYPHAQHIPHFLYSLVVRYTGTPAAFVPRIRGAVGEIDPNLPIGDVTTLANVVEDSVLNKRLIAQLSTFFGILAAFLASIGIFGVMSYAIERRTNEFGVRMALGAGRSGVLWTVLREILWLVCAGLSTGLVLALASRRAIANLLFGVDSLNPMVIGLSIIALSAAALCAGYLPARRATRIDPMAALRYE